MVIFKDFVIQTRSDVPNADWTNGEARYVVEDGSPLYEKILSCLTFEPIEDENGKLIDIIPIKRFANIEASDAVAEAGDDV